MVSTIDTRSFASTTNTKVLQNHDEDVRQSLLAQKTIEIMYDSTIFERIKKNNIYNLKKTLVSESFKKEKELFELEVSLRSTGTFIRYSALPISIEKRKKSLFEKFSTNRSKV